MITGTWKSRQTEAATTPGDISNNFQIMMSITNAFVCIKTLYIDSRSNLMINARGHNT